MKFFKQQNKIVKNILWLFFDKILRMSLGVLVSIYLAKYLGPTEYGELSFCVSFLYFFLVVSMLGMEPILVREITKSPSKTDEIISTSIVLRICSGFILFVVSVLTAFYLYGLSKFFFILIISFQLFFQAGDVFGSLFLAKVKSKYVVISKNVGFIISSILKLILIFLNVSLLTFAYAILIEFFIALLLLIYFFNKSEVEFKFSYFDTSLAKELLISSSPLILSSIFYVVYTKLDQVMIEFLSDSEQVGYYAVANKLSEVWFFIPTVVVNSFYSEIVALKNTNYKKFKDRILELMTLLSFLSVILILGFSLFSEVIITFLYGQEYASSVPIFNVHIWSCLIVFSAVVSGVWYVATDLQKYTFYRTGVGALVNVSLNFALIPLYGGLGAAYATLGAKILASYLMNLMNKKTREVFFLQTEGYINIFKIYPVILFSKRMIYNLKKQAND
ncbi:flippase [Aquimarina spongiae]|uniref:Membrane protein involved in the export of O-antigen and teichoic acid n=1 Tax=Aquimarina spongiae TaxID=570521 RepID=A0A1M6FA72_9FLAO|nr:flippase [Aquimarina spongiae]SHI94644.1 Membrane protein involved in the export of O-antigen and teichoic acid [Aquimarina spongiae]